MKRILAMVLACLLLGNLTLNAFATEISVDEAVNEERVAAWETYCAEFAEVTPDNVAEEEFEKIKDEIQLPSLKARAAQVYEEEPNDYPYDAERIYNEYTVGGYLSYKDVDFSKIVLSEASEVLAVSVAESASFGLGIWDDNRGEFLAVSLPMGMDSGYYVYLLNAIIPAGTYYVCALDMDDNTGEYAFTIGWKTAASVPMYRMYDPNSGEHFYTGSEVERDFLVNAGWHYEGVGFNFPREGKPVYRLYEPVYGEHLYTMDEAERAKLISWGWNDEGVAFNSAESNEVPQYRLRNPNAKRGGYHFTGSAQERQDLMNVGWVYEGIGWYSCAE